MFSLTFIIIFRSEMQELIAAIAANRNDLPNLLRQEIVPLVPNLLRDGPTFSADSFTSGVSVFISMLFILFNIPLFCPNEIDLENIRFLMVHWVKVRALPM